MKTIGLIGGMSYESTISYYAMINEMVKEKLGGLNSAKILLYSVNFDEIEKLQHLGEWEKSGEILAEIASNLEKAGADCILICTNTMHKVAKQVESAISINLLHIADATASEILNKNISKVALLGTKYTMTQDFYKQRLIDRGIEVLIPEQEDIEEVNRIIFDELCLGKILDSSKAKYLELIHQLKAKGAQAVILGCTEIGLLIGQNDTDLIVFDTTAIHAQKAVEFALTED